MTRRLVFVHGRSQQHRDALELKTAWIEGWRAGLDGAGLGMPITADDVRFPYYGQTLHDLESGAADEDVAEVIVRGAKHDPSLEAFVADALDEVLHTYGVTEDAVLELAEHDVLERGILDKEWVHSILKAIDKYVPGASGATVALVTHDVYHYLNNPGARDEIETGVRRAMSSSVECVVVGHSLGSVVAYNLLKREGAANGWKIPLFVTIGSPLAIKMIEKRLRPHRPLPFVRAWFNALDERDVVALHPLDAGPYEILNIENKRDVDNGTSNHHGISGYLRDSTVASRLHAALTAR